MKYMRAMLMGAALLTGGATFAAAQGGCAGAVGLGTSR